MRTTLTLDPDVVALLRDLQKRTGQDWKATVNRALREGAVRLGQNKRTRRTPYATQPVDSGTPAITGVHSVADMLAFAEGDDFR
jgi:hypothetical protein